MGLNVAVIDLGGAATAVAMVAVAAGSAAQAVTGFGFSLVCVPVLVLLMEPVDAVRLALVTSVPLNVAVLGREHRQVRGADAGRLLAPAIAVTPVAAYLVRRADDAVLSLLVGALVVACAVALWCGARAERLRGRRGELAAGAAGAAMNAASGIGGPTVAMYAVNAGWPAEATRPTLQVYFLGLNAITLAALGLVTPSFTLAVALGAALATGVAAGAVVARRLSTPVVTRVVLMLALAGGVTAIVKGVLQA